MNVACAHNCAKKNDKFVQVLRVDFSDRLSHNFFGRGYIDQLHIKLLMGDETKDLEVKFLITLSLEAA